MESAISAVFSKLHSNKSVLFISVKNLLFIQEIKRIVTLKFWLGVIFVTCLWLTFLDRIIFTEVVALPCQKFAFLVMGEKNEC